MLANPNHFGTKAWLLLLLLLTRQYISEGGCLHDKSWVFSLELIGYGLHIEGFFKVKEDKFLWSNTFMVIIVVYVDGAEFKEFLEIAFFLII